MSISKIHSEEALSLVLELLKDSEDDLSAHQRVDRAQRLLTNSLAIIENAKAPLLYRNCGLVESLFLAMSWGGLRKVAEAILPVEGTEWHDAILVAERQARRDRELATKMKLDDRESNRN